MKQTSKTDVLAQDKKCVSTDIVAILRLLSLAECAWIFFLSISFLFSTGLPYEMWAVASTLQSTTAELAMTKSIHSSRNSSCAYCVHYSWNQSLFPGALRCNKCYSKCTECSPSSYSFLQGFLSSSVEQNTTLCILPLHILGSIISGRSFPFCLSFSTLISISTWILFAIFKS